MPQHQNLKIKDNLNVKDMGTWNNVGLHTLIKKEVMRFMSVYMQTIIAPVVTTFLFYLVFSVALGGDERLMNGIPYMLFVTPGLIMMNMAQNSFANSSSSLIIAKFHGNIVDIIMAPLSYVEIFLGYIIGAVLRGLLIGIMCIAVFAIFEGYIPALPLNLLIFGVLGSFMLGVMGLIGGLWASSFDSISAVSNFAIMPLTFLSGTFYSIDQLSGSWQTIAYFNPFFYMIDGFRSGMTGESEANVLVSITVLCTINIVLSLIALRILKTGYKIKS